MIDPAPFIDNVAALVHELRSFDGTPRQLLTALEFFQPQPTPAGWPQTPREASQHLRAGKAMLRQHGLTARREVLPRLVGGRLERRWFIVDAKHAAAGVTGNIPDSRSAGVLPADGPPKPNAGEEPAVDGRI